MTTPFWQEVVKAVLEYEFHLSIGSSNEMAWGFALCCVGVLYHLLSTGLYEVALAINSKGKDIKIFEHDRQIFNNFQDLLSEEQLEIIIGTLEGSHSITHNNSEAIYYFFNTADSSSNMFINVLIKDKMESLSKSAQDFYIFINDNFDEYPYGQSISDFKMCLAPQLNCDRAGSFEDMPRYDLLAGQLEVKARKLLSCYKEWRIAVKDTLYF